MSQTVMFDMFKYKTTSTSTSKSNTTTDVDIATSIPSCRDLRKLNLHIEKNKKNEEKANKLKDKYDDALDSIIKKNSKYQSISLVDDIKLFNRERVEIKGNTYYGYTEKNTFVDTILHIIEWFKDFQTKITFKTIERMIEMLRFENHSRYFIRTIIDNPYELIQIEHSTINFNQAFRIAKELQIPVSDEILIQKWAIFAVQDNNGSFYKIKSHPDSNDAYKQYSDRSYKQGWYWLLRKFCDENKLLAHYSKYLVILNSLLVEHKTMKNLYGIEDFVEIEKNVGDAIMDLYYDNSNELDEEAFDSFIVKFEQGKSTFKTPFKFNHEQIIAIKHAITDKLCIITGPPGTGKSTIVEAVIEWFNIQSKQIKHEYVISLMAPTGKAFKGLLDKCTNINDDSICGTLHKCLLNTFPKMEKQIDDASSGKTIEYDEDVTRNITKTKKQYPQYINKIIVDETSMVDIFMFRKLLKKCKYFNCDLVLCGDIKQLPPVGKGRPFECIIKSELFNTIILTEIKRQDTGKLKDCIIKINTSELTIGDFDNDSTIFIDHDFMCEDETVQICNKLVNKYGRNNIAFITPENNKQPGVFEMNKLLQNKVYNSTRPYYHGYFKDCDYVMRTENKYDDEVIRVNGDTGIISFHDKKAYIHYDDDPINNVETVTLYDIADNFTVNYCNTVHKYQGSQKDVVVFICSSVHSSLSWGTNRLKLAYTAISRAAKNLIILGDKDTFFNIQNCKEEPFVSSFMSEFNDCEIELEYE
jgi:hypothetical protein